MVDKYGSIELVDLNDESNHNSNVLVIFFEGVLGYSK